MNYISLIFALENGMKFYGCESSADKILMISKLGTNYIRYGSYFWKHRKTEANASNYDNVFGIRTKYHRLRCFLVFS